MSWIEDEAARQAQFAAKLTEAWDALKAALERDINEYGRHFGTLYDVETKSRGNNGFMVMFQEGSDRFAGRRDIHVEIDFAKREITAAVTQTSARQVFKIVPDAQGNPVFERAGLRYTAEEVSREILKPHLSRVRD